MLGRTLGYFAACLTASSQQLQRTGLLLLLTEKTEHLDLLTPHAASAPRACIPLHGGAGEVGAATGVVLQREL